MECPMARTKSLSSLSVDELLELRANVGAVLARKADDLRKALASFSFDRGSRRTPKRRSSLAGRRVAPKYRGPNGETWAGRGAQPRWLTALVKAGRKRNDFLIE